MSTLRRSARGGHPGGRAGGRGVLHARPLGRLGARRGLGERARYSYTRWKLSSNHETHTGIKICEHASKLQLMELFLLESSATVWKKLMIEEASP